MSAATTRTENDAASDSSPATDQSKAPNRTEINLLGQVDVSAGEGRRNENVQIDLIDNNVLKELNVRMGTTATVVNELEIDRGYYAAEYGVDPSTPLHLLPSPANRIHGSLYEAHNNSIFSARSFFQVGDVQPARDNDYGFTFGTPLWPGAAIFVDGSQQKLRGNVNGNVLVPRPDERISLATDPATREMVGRILASYPDEFPNRTDINERALNTNSPQRIGNDFIGAQLDQSWQDKDRFSLRYQLTSQTVDAFQLVAGQNPDTTTKSHDARITWTRNWSAGTITDLSMGFDRLGSLLVPDENAFGPVILTGLVFQFLGPGSNIPIDRAQNEFHYAGQLRQVRGRHLWTSGAQLVRRQINGVESSSHRGLFSFRDDFDRDVIANIRLGTPSSYSISIGDVHRGFRNWDMRYFIGDQWRLSRDLTLSLGLRYELVTSTAEVNNLSAIPYDCDCNNLAPRFGFAYRLREPWGVLRGAYGIHYGEIFPVTFGQARFNTPGNLRLTIPTPSLVDPLGGLSDEDLSPNARSVLFDLSPDLASPYSHQYNLEWELEPLRQWRVSFGYLGSRTPKLLHMWYFNRGRPTPGIDQLTDTIDERRPDPRFLDIRRVLNGSFGYYDAGRVNLTIPRWRRLTVDASYWFSKAIDLGSDYTNTAAGRDSRQARSQSEFNVHGDVKGPSSFDQRHAAQWRFTYEMPRLSGRPSWLRKVFGDWQLFTVVLLKSGTPFTLSSGSDGPGTGNVDGAGGDRPNVLDPTVLGRSIDHPDTSKTRLPASAFGFIQPADSGGNLGRNTFRKDGIRNVNAAISRNWPLGQERTLTFRAESLNFLNTPQFAEPGREVSNPNFGAITNTLNDGRTFRLWLRFAF